MCETDVMGGQDVVCMFWGGHTPWRLWWLFTAMAVASVRPISSNNNGLLYRTALLLFVLIDMHVYAALTHHLLSFLYRHSVFKATCWASYQVKGLWMYGQLIL